jgi:hypothetical protein
VKRKELKMKKNFVFVGALVLVFACASFAFAAEHGATMKKQTGEPGAVAIMTATATATVQSVDAAKRKVTLKMPDGKMKTLKVGKEVRNFDQIKAGDKVRATYVEELAVFLNKSGAPAGAEEMSTVMLAPKGAKPGMVAADTVQMRAQVKAVDPAKRTVTLIDPAGQTKKVKVSKNVNLNNVKMGDDVVVRYTEAMAVTVERP